MTSGNSTLHPLVRKLESIFRLTDDERSAILTLPIQQVEVRADQDIVREGDQPTRCFVILEGVTCVYKVTGAGKRQIMAFHIPGDAPDLQSLHLGVLDVTLATITPCKLAFIRHDAARDLCVRFPRIGSAFWRDTLIDASIYREWLANIGRRDAAARIAHLMCEMFVKFESVGLAVGNSIPFPITQGEIADALGLSSVHVNRSLMALRKSGLIAVDNSKLEVLDREGLERAGDFDPAYLHLQNQEVAA